MANKLVDLSYPITMDSPVYPGDPETTILEKRNISQHRVRVSAISFGTHSGTHVDVPAHIFSTGKNIGEMALSSFCGQAIKLSLEQLDTIELNDLVCDGIIIDTGWAACYNDVKVYYSNLRPTFKQSSIEKIVRKGVKFFGCDLPSVDQSGSKEKIIHEILLGNEIVIYENLTNLQEIPFLVSFQFMAFPLKFVDLDGSPVRAVAAL